MFELASRYPRATYKQIGAACHLSVERVRQLLAREALDRGMLPEDWFEERRAARRASGT